MGRSLVLVFFSPPLHPPFVILVPREFVYRGEDGGRKDKSRYFLCLLFPVGELVKNS